MPPCPYCGADNPEDAAFCSLCLVDLTKRPTPDTTPVPPPGGEEPNRTVGEGLGSGTYVSPADFRSVAGEIVKGAGGFAEETVPAHRTPIARADDMRAAGRRKGAETVLLVLKHSLLVFLLFLIAGFILSFLILGAAYGGSFSGLSIGLGISYAVEALLLIWGGYRIAVEAMERGRSWMYGMACVAMVVFLWQPLFALLFGFLFTGRTVLPQTFSLLGILVAVLLFLPLGALGGWIAERRYMG